LSPNNTGASVKYFIIALAVIYSQSISAKISFTYHDFAPFAYAKEGQAQGILVDLIKLVCREMKEQCEFEYYPNKRSKDYMAMGLVTGNFPLGWNVSRQKWIHFSAPLLTTSYSFFGLKKNDILYTQLADLEGLVIGVVGASNLQFTLEKIRQQMMTEGLKPIEIDIHPNSDGKGLLKLAKGRYSLYFANSDLANYRIQQLKIAGVENKGRYKSQEYHVGFAKAHIDPKLIIRFNQAILRLYRRSAFDLIWLKWQSKPGKIQPSHLQKLEILH